MKKRNALTGVFALLFASMLLITSCGGGGGASSSGDGSFDGSADESPDGGAGTPISSLSFDLTGAIGLAIDDSPEGSALIADGSDGGYSNLKRVEPDNTLSSAVSSGSVSVQSFMVAANNQVYLLLSSPVESCILIRVDGETNEATCVDSTLSEITWDNEFGDPVQFDGEGNVYYQGSTNDGRTVLRKNASGTTTDLINDYISLRGFVVLTDGTVFYSGTTTSTGTEWTRIITPSGSLKAFLMHVPSFLSVFPDNNVYFGLNWSPMQGVFRYLTATDESDSYNWIGDDKETSYYNCPDPASYGWRCGTTNSIVRTTNGKVYAMLGVSGQNMLAQFYPVVSQTNTTVTDVTLFKSILTYILLGGFDSGNKNKLMFYDTNADTETDLLGSEDIEVYHVNYLNSSDHQIVMFDGLRFSDNRYVLCQVDLTDNNALTCSLTDTGKLTDFQLFDNTDTIAGGGTNATKTYTIGGTVTGLYGTLVLQNNGDDIITLTKNGPFTFPIAVAGNYDVTVQTQPQGQTCTVSDGSGTASDHHVTSVSVVCSTNPGFIVTVAGGGSAFPGDGGIATNALLDQPYGIVSDPSGNLYITAGTRIRKVDTNGTISTVAGAETSGFAGDGGAATSARISYPRGLAVDSLGNLYVSDTQNYRIRKVDTNGNISTVAGSGVSGFSGDGGIATSAQLNWPGGIAVDALGNLYVADTQNNRIRKVDTNGIITTVVGGGASLGDGGSATSASLNQPSAVAFDALGNLYIADTENNRIRMVDANGDISTVAGNGVRGFLGDEGAATSAQLNQPRGIALDASGNFYISDSNNYRVRMVDTNGNISTVAGNGTQDFAGDGGLAVSAALNQPTGMTLNPSGDLYIVSNSRIRMVAGE